MQFNKIVVNGSAFICVFTIDPVRRERFIALFDDLWTRFIDTMERDTNFVFYGWGRDPNQFYCVESWKSEEATNAVRGLPIFQERVGELIDCCSAPMRLTILSGMRSDRSVFDLYPAGKSDYHPATDSNTGVFN